MLSPDIVQLWIGAYSKCLGVGSHGVQFSMGVEFSAADRLHVLERRDRNESRSAAVAAAVAGVQLLPRLLLKPNSPIWLLASPPNRSNCEHARASRADALPAINHTLGAVQKSANLRRSDTIDVVEPSNMSVGGMCVTERCSFNHSPDCNRWFCYRLHIVREFAHR